MKNYVVIPAKAGIQKRNGYGLDSGLRRNDGGLLTIVLFVISILLFSISWSWSAAFEAYGLGARSVGMSSSLVAAGDDYTALYHNPAGIACVEEKTFHSEYRNLYGLDLLRYTSFGYLHPGIGKGSFGFTWYRLDTMGDASTLDYAENTIAFSYGVKVHPALAVGMNGKYYRVHSTLGGSGMGADFGLLYVVKEPWLTIGGAVQDLNRTLISWDSGVKERVPMRVRAGMSLKPWKRSLITAQVDWRDMEDETHRAGFEQEFFDQILAFRAGGSERKGTINFSWGLAVRWKGWALDYGWERELFLGDTQVFSLSIRF